MYKVEIHNSNKMCNLIIHLIMGVLEIKVLLEEQIFSHQGFKLKNHSIKALEEENKLPNIHIQVNIFINLILIFRFGSWCRIRLTL